MKLEAAVIQGDGVGPEMMEEAVRVLQAVCRRFGHHLKLYPVLACSQAIEAGKEPLPQESLKICTQVPAVLFGNSGLKKYQDWPLDKRPEGALMILRKVLQVSTNIRPVRMYPSLKCFSPLKAERLEQGMDVAFVRDIAGGVFCSAKVQGNGDGGREAYEYEYYNETIVRKTAYTAFKLAKSRKNKVTNLDKSNVLGSSRLWRQTVQQVSEDFPDVELEHLYIDNAAMELIRNPGRFDVFVTSNLFGDIISDEGTELTGTPYLYPSAELSNTEQGIYTPNQLHYPDESVIGKQKVSPVGMIMAAALMLRCSFGLEKEAKTVENAIEKVLEAKISTEDMKYPGAKIVLTGEMADFCCQFLGKDV
jgi:3-isopropylmalate dehydrogenase